MNDLPVGNFTSSLKCLLDKGIRFSTVIDLGCADGQFYLYHRLLGVIADATALNIDANPIYEPSLKAIQAVTGGHYLIAAVTDHEGEVEMISSVHPYWSSIQPENDPYWERINHLYTGKVKVPAVTLDSVAERLRLSPPFLLKLDIQGAETQALNGARKVLAQTDAVICEAIIDDFQSIHQVLTDSGFGLFDVTAPNWLPDRSLGWFYPVYLKRRLDGRKQRAFWDEADNVAVTKMQADRRESVLKQNALMLEELRKQIQLR